MEFNCFNEPLVDSIKSVYNPRGLLAANLFQKEVVAQIVMVFRTAKLSIVQVSDAILLGTSYTEV